MLGAWRGTDPSLLKPLTMNLYLLRKYNRIVDEKVVEDGPFIMAKNRKTAHWTARELGYNDYMVCNLTVLVPWYETGMTPEVHN